MRLLLLVGVLIVSVAAHAALGSFLHQQRPPLGILPPLPSDLAVQALDFGDSQFLYRSFVLQIQNAGDTGGRFTPMADYDIPAVVSWLGVLQRMDPRSNHYTALAVRYFSQLRQGDDIRTLIDFVDRDVDLAPEQKWYWQTQIVALARDGLKDPVYALALSRKLARFASYVPEGYMWVLQMEPILLRDLGREDEARAVMERVVAQHGDKMNEFEKTWTRNFFE